MHCSYGREYYLYNANSHCLVSLVEEIDMHCSLLQNSSYKRQIIRSGALPPLVNMIVLEHRKCRARGACAIAALIENDNESAQAICSAGGVEALASLLRDGVCTDERSQFLSTDCSE